MSVLQSTIKEQIKNSCGGCNLTRSDNWETPFEIFNLIEDFYLKGKFDIDLCASAANTKCDSFISEKINLFTLYPNHFKYRKAAFMNPPYRKKMKSEKYALPDFITYAESIRTHSDIDVACLVSANITSSVVFQDVIGETEKDRKINHVELFFIPKRVQFLNESKQIEKNPAFASMVVIFRKLSYG